MVQLLVKDIRIQKQFIVLGFIFVGFFFFVLGAFEGVPLAMPAAIFSHFLIVVASKSDEKNNNGRMLASFPLRRKDIVTSKYVGIFVFMVIAFLLTFLWRVLAAVVFPVSELPWFSGNSTWITIVIMLVFYSIYFPMFFAFGSRIIQVLDLIVIFTVAGAVLIVLRLLELLHVSTSSFMGEVLSGDSVFMSLWAAGACLVIILASWFISMKVYERKNI